MAYVYSPRWLWVTVVAVLFLLLAYFVEQPSWVAGADLAFLNIDPQNTELKRNMLFVFELLAWVMVLMTQLILLSMLHEKQSSYVQDLNVRFRWIWITLDVAIVAGMLLYHSHMIFNEGEEPLPRSMLALFSIIMFRQILFNLIFASKHVVNELLGSLNESQIHENYFIFGRRTRRRTALAVVIYFLIAASLIVWSPSLLPAGISPQYIAIVVAFLVTLPSIFLSFYVQQRMLAVFDTCLEPLEREISKASANVEANKDELERISGLIEVRSEFSKVASLPWLTAAFSLLQVAVAIVTIVAVFK